MFKTLIVALLLPAAAMAAGPRIPVTAAMAQCKALDGPSAVAKAHYGDCVQAKSGQRPPAPARKSGITISGSARIGVVVTLD